MNKKLSVIYFSPTGTTRKATINMAESIDPDYIEYDITLPGSGLLPQFTSEDTIILGVPVYAGSAPQIALDRLNDIRGENTKIILVAVYGNRHFDDTFQELSHFVQERGFQTIAAAAFIGEHSYSNSQYPVAVGRPNSEDLKIAAEFGEKIRDILETSSLLNAPGNYPFEKRHAKFGSAAEIDFELCTNCGTCAANCPSAAIAYRDGKLSVEEDLCIYCCACIRNCPTGAVQIQAKELSKFAKMLHENCSLPKIPELFLAE